MLKHSWVEEWLTHNMNKRVNHFWDFNWVIIVQTVLCKINCYSHQYFSKCHLKKLWQEEEFKQAHKWSVSLSILWDTVYQNIYLTAKLQTHLVNHICVRKFKHSLVSDTLELWLNCDCVAFLPNRLCKISNNMWITFALHQMWIRILKWNLHHIFYSYDVLQILVMF